MYLNDMNKPFLYLRKIRHLLLECITVAEDGWRTAKEMARKYVFIKHIQNRYLRCE